MIPTVAFGLMMDLMAYIKPVQSGILFMRRAHPWEVQVKTLDPTFSELLQAMSEYL
jgi:hypothetical protein